MTKSDPQTDTVIKISGVTKAFKDVVAVNNISLDVQRGQYIALLGPNGAGKTTLIEMIEGIQKPDSGDIYIMGKSFSGNETMLRRSMGISLQETRFIDKLTVKETIDLFASFHGSDEKDSNSIVDVVGLGDKNKSYVMNLSGGQRQKLALAIALLNKPEILLLDEPTTGLDPNARRDIWKIVSSLKDNRTTLILTTHYMEEAEKLCDRIIIMHRGKFIADGTLDELISLNGCCGIIHITVSEDFKSSSLKTLKGVHEIKNDGKGNYRIFVEDNIATMPDIMSLAKKEGLKIVKLESRHLSLDDIFTSMTGQHLDDTTTL